METYEARLESYGTGKPSKKRNSTTKGGKGPNWPHSDPSPASLAKAGFFYDPNEISADRVTCCLCQTVLDGWEANDDPIKEHFNYSPECAIAIHAKIEQDVELGITIEHDPNSEAMLIARKETFRDLWPHEKKRGWTCKTQKMAEAGWYYCPTDESDDFVKCAYCGLSLDGWEPKDKPFDEHQRRSASCIVVSSQPPAKAKGGRSKKSRASKASRLSTQSTTTAGDDTALIDATMDEGDTVLTTVTEGTQSTTAKPKKGARTKKGKSKSKAAVAAASDSALASSMIEPEDDDFEVKIASPLPKSRQSRKRKSDEMEDGDEEQKEAPAPKRRGVKSRSSMIQPEATMEVAPSEDTTMADLETKLPAKPAPKKKGKQTARSRAPSAKRKASAASIVSQASLHDTVPADEELEAALEADLDRPLTDEEMPPKPAPRSRAASKSQKKKAPVSAAAPRQEARESTGSTATMQTANEESSTILNGDETFASVAPIKNPKQRATRKGKAQPEPSDDAVDNDTDALSQPAEAHDEAPARGKGRQPSRKASRQVSRQKPKQAETQQAESAPPKETEKAAQDTTPAELTMIHNPPNDVDDSQKQTKNVKRAVSATKKGKKGKAPAAKDTVVESHVQAVIELEEDQEAAALEDVVEHSKPEPEQELEQEPLKPKASRGRPKKKLTKEPQAVPETDDAETIVEPPQDSEASRTLPGTPVKTKSPPSSTQQIPSPTPSLQSSDAENHPPSSRPSATRPPLVAPTSPVVTRVPLAVSTPTAARSNLNPSKLATAFPWTSVDLDYALAGTPGASGQENIDLSQKFMTAELTSPEKNMTVEQWIRHQATLGQDRLRDECEKIVQRFENEGVRAMKALEGIIAEDS